MVCLFFYPWDLTIRFGASPPFTRQSKLCWLSAVQSPGYLSSLLPFFSGPGAYNPRGFGFDLLLSILTNIFCARHFT